MSGQGYSYKFDSVAELLAAVEAPHVCSDNAKHAHYSGLAGHTDWVCADRRTTSHADVNRHLAAPTFERGVERVERLAKGLAAPTPLSRRRQPVRAAEGDELDMGRVWQGDLEHAWRAMRREQSVGPSRVLVVISLDASFEVSPERLAYRGAAALALYTALKSSGYTVSVVGVVSAVVHETPQRPYTAEVSLVQPDHELDIHKLASLVASALLFRGVILNHMLRVANRAVEQGLGRTADLDMSKLDTTGYDLVAHIDSGISSQRSAEKWLSDTLKRLCPDGQSEE